MWVVFFFCSVVPVPARARAALLPSDGILSTAPCTAAQRARVRRVEHTRQPHDTAPRLPHQLHHEPPHRRLRARHILAPADLCGLPGGVSQMALHGLAPPLRRVFLPSTTTAAAAGAGAATAGATAEATAGHVGGATSAAPRAAAAGVRHAVAQSGAGERERGLLGAVAVHRDVLRYGPRVPHLSWLQVSARRDDGRVELRRRVYR